ARTSGRGGSWDCSRQHRASVLGDEYGRELRLRRLMCTREEEILRRDLGVDRVAGDDREPDEIRFRRCTRAGIDQMVELAAVAPPHAPVAPGGGELAGAQLERQGTVGRLDPHGPAAAADGDVASRVDEARAADGEDLRGTLRRVALADAAEVEPDAVLEHDGVTGDLDAAACGPRNGGRRVRVGDLVERPVVAGADERVVHGRVEAAVRPFACGERELDDATEVRPCVERARAVQLRQLRALTEAREDLLEPLEL